MSAWIICLWSAPPKPCRAAGRTGAGVTGGLVGAQGTPNEICRNRESLTADYLTGRRSIALPKKYQAPDPKRMLQITRASGNNLKDVTLNLPVGLMGCVTGASGSSK